MLVVAVGAVVVAGVVEVPGDTVVVVETAEVVVVDTAVVVVEVIRQSVKYMVELVKI